MGSGGPCAGECGSGGVSGEGDFNYILTESGCYRFPPGGRPRRGRNSRKMRVGSYSFPVFSDVLMGVGTCQVAQNPSADTGDGVLIPE